MVASFLPYFKLRFATHQIKAPEKLGFVAVEPTVLGKLTKNSRALATSIIIAHLQQAVFPIIRKVTTNHSLHIHRLGFGLVKQDPSSVDGYC